MKANRAIEHLKKCARERAKTMEISTNASNDSTLPMAFREKYRIHAEADRTFIADADAVIAAWEAAQGGKDKDNGGL